MKSFNRLYIIWYVFAILIFAGLCTLGFVYKSKIKKFKKFEDNIIIAAESYVLSEGKIDFLDDYIDVNINTLLKKGYLLKKDYVKSCSGKVRIKKGKTTKYTPLIKCKNYKSY